MSTEPWGISITFYKLFSNDPAMSSILEDKDHLICLGKITHPNQKIINALFLQLSSEYLSDIHFLYKEDNAFIGIAHNENNLYLFSNRAILSPTLFSKAMAILLYHMDHPIFQKVSQGIDVTFMMESLEVRISTPDKMETFTLSTLKGKYEEEQKCIHFVQRKEEEIYTLFEKMCTYVVDLALPVSKIGAERLTGRYLVPMSYLEERVFFYRTHNIKLDLPNVETYLYDEIEYVMSFNEVEKELNRYELVPIATISKEGFLIPPIEQIKLICLTMDLLQKKIFMRVLKLIGPFMPISYGYENEVFFSKEIVIQMGKLLVYGNYYEQDNLILLSNVMDYLNTLGSHNVEENPVYRYD